MIFVRLLFGICILALLAGCSPATGPATVARESGGRAVGCRADEAATTVVVRRGERVVLRKRLCSSADTDARVITDSGGRVFLLTRYAARAGVARTEYLTVDEVTWPLRRRATVVVGASAGVSGRWRYDDRMEALPGGGVDVWLGRRLEGAIDPKAALPPPLRRMRLPTR